MYFLHSALPSTFFLVFFNGTDVDYSVHVLYSPCSHPLPFTQNFFNYKIKYKEKAQGLEGKFWCLKNNPPPPTCHHGLWNMHENGHISTCTQRNALSLHFFIKLWGETGFGRGALKDTWRGQLWPPDMWKCQKKVAKTETPLDRNLAYNTELGTSIAP